VFYRYLTSKGFLTTINNHTSLYRITIVMESAYRPEHRSGHSSSAVAKSPHMHTTAEQPSSMSCVGHIPQRRAALLRLPAELLLAIVEHVKSEDRDNLDYSTLSKLSRVNRLFYELTVDYLYEEYDNHCHLKRPHLYLRTLMENPDIAVKVRKLKYNTFGQYNFPVSVLEVIETKLHALQIPYEPRVAISSSGLNSYVPDEILVGVILLYTPHVTELDICSSADFRSHLWLQAIGRALCRVCWSNTRICAS
jgi:hypothetical protein